MEMRNKEAVLALDLSSKPGWAIFKDGKLVDSGTLFPDKSVRDFGLYPQSYYQFAHHVCNDIDELIYKIQSKYGQIEHFIIEETVSSRNNLSQKILEYIHCLFIGSHFKSSIKYIRTGV